MPQEPHNESKPTGWIGSGLSASWLAGIFVFSIVVFLFWDGPLWSSSKDESHLMRISVSYLLVIPTVAAALMIAKRFSWMSVITSTGLLWTAKLGVSLALYYAVAPGTANRYEPRTPEITEKHKTRKSGYEAAPDSYPMVQVTGSVTRDGAGVKNAIVYVDKPAPGRAKLKKKWPLVIESGAYDSAVYIATVGDELLIDNRDSELHTLRIENASGAHTTPVPPSSDNTDTALPTAGRFDIRCMNHPTERARLLVVDHPYVARTDAQGRFELDAVPNQGTELVATADGALLMRKALASQTGTTTAVVIDLDASARVVPSSNDPLSDNEVALR